MLLQYWGMRVSPAQVGRAAPETELGCRAADLRAFARKQGLNALILRGELSDIEEQLKKGRPLLIGIVKRYGDGSARPSYQLVVGYHPTTKSLVTIDPAAGFRQTDPAGLLEEWEPTGRLMLLVYPTP